MNLQTIVGKVHDQTSTKNVPVPDMPIYFGFVIAFIAIVFLTNREEKK